MADLSAIKKAQRLRIYISESDRWRSKALDAALLEIFRAQGMAGATVFRGVAGFGAHSRLHSTSIEVLSFDLPIVIEVVDAPEKITAVLQVIYPMIREGLITVEDVQVVKYTHRLLNPLPVDRLVSEVMTREVVALQPDTSISQAWKMMLEKTIKAMPVITLEGKVVGILTDEDLLKRAGLQQRLSVAIRMEVSEIEHELRLLEGSPIRVADVMSKPVITINQTSSLGEATILMVKKGLKRLPVVNEEGRLVGVLSRLDILRQVGESPTGTNAQRQMAGIATTVNDVMLSTIPMVNQDDNIPMIIEKFTQSQTHRLIVVDSAGKVIGLLSDSDVVARVQPAKRRSILDAFHQISRPPSGKETAYDLMSVDPLMAGPDLPVMEAARKMLAESRKWLVVVDHQKKPLGLVDRQVLLKAITPYYEGE